MTQLEQCMGWLEERVPTSASAKDYIKFIMQDYAQKYHESEVKKLGLFSVTRSALQLCPKCNGQGTVSKPPWVAGDVNQWTSSESSYTCDVCNGAKVI